MKLINCWRRLLLLFVSGGFALVLLAGAPSKSQEQRRPGFPDPRADVIKRPEDTRTRHFGSDLIFIPFGFTPVPLDVCREFGSNCGKPAADAFCHSRGYRTASKFEIHPSVGHTATFSEHRICDGPVCGGFWWIDCVGTATVFETPWITASIAGEARLDWCRDWESNCGKPAADAYCQSRGLSKGALSFEIDPHVNLFTATINGQRVCEGTKRNCDSFKRIECDSGR